MKFTLWVWIWSNNAHLCSVNIANVCLSMDSLDLSPSLNISLWVAMQRCPNKAYASGVLVGRLHKKLERFAMYKAMCVRVPLLGEARAGATQWPAHHSPVANALAAAYVFPACMQTGNFNRACIMHAHLNFGHQTFSHLPFSYRYVHSCLCPLHVEYAIANPFSCTEILKRTSKISAHPAT